MNFQIVIVFERFTAFGAHVSSHVAVRLQVNGQSRFERKRFLTDGTLVGFDGRVRFEVRSQIAGVRKRFVAHWTDGGTFASVRAHVDFSLVRVFKPFFAVFALEFWWFSKTSKYSLYKHLSNFHLLVIF